ncbi:MAG: hypothetical protein DSZ08_06005 [Sulfurovum sp.]|nr:MAG: hypothetical protein DSZ08_06005 [Sulfurovum sp.]
MMMIKIILLAILGCTLGFSQNNQDQDMDGVPDQLDHCLDTPFLDEVDETGCSISSHLDISIGYGFNTNEDLVNRATQHAIKFDMSYYYNDWNYALKTGIIAGEDDAGMQDTTLKIKRKFNLSDALKINLGVGMKLPTYHIKGNKTDFIVYASTRYYPLASLSLYAGVNHTFVQDKEVTIPLQDTHTFYLGTGYFFTKRFYANFTYSEATSKFTSNKNIQSFSSTLFYKINDNWFSTLSYSHQINDDDLHNAFNIKIGYSLW